MSDEVKTFSEVLRNEWDEAIRKRRHKVEGQSGDGGDHCEPARGSNEDEKLKQARLWSLKQHVTGLSFSGGGIRAGTFAIGFLQGLASLGLIRR